MVTWWWANRPIGIHSRTPSSPASPPQRAARVSFMGEVLKTTKDITGMNHNLTPPYLEYTSDNRLFTSCLTTIGLLPLHDRKHHDIKARGHCNGSFCKTFTLLLSSPSQNIPRVVSHLGSKHHGAAVSEYFHSWVTCSFFFKADQCLVVSRPYTLPHTHPSSSVLP